MLCRLNSGYFHLSLQRNSERLEPRGKKIDRYKKQKTSEQKLLEVEDLFVKGFEWESITAISKNPQGKHDGALYLLKFDVSGWKLETDERSS